MQTNIFLIVKEYFQKDWNRAASERRYRIKLYTLLFALVFLIIYRPYLISTKSFVWTVDGTNQMLPWLAYTGRWVRSIISNFVHGVFTIPQYDLSLGWGDGIIGFLGANGQFDPIALILTTIVPMEYCEYLYTFLSVIRLYFSGLAFLHLCVYFKKTNYASFIGCLVYLFNAYALYISTGVPNYVNMMILLPLLIVETEKMLSKEKKCRFTLWIFMTALCSFYFLYMVSIIIVVYALVRFFHIYGRGERIKNFFRITGKGIALYLLGVMLAAPVVIPSVFALIDSARNGYSTLTLSGNIGIHWQYFWMRLMSLVTPKAGYVLDFALDFPTLAAITLPLFGIVFSSKGKKSLKWLLAITLLILFCPLGGWAMNGFQYVCNRWIFAFTLLAGYIVADCLPDLLASKKKLIICIASVVCYIVAGTLSPSAREGVHFLHGLVALIITGVIISLPKEVLTIKIDLRLKKIMCFFIVAINIAANNTVLCSYEGADWIAQFMSVGKSTEQFENYTEATAAEQIYSKGTMDGRIDSSHMAYNGSLYTGVPGTSVYTSTANANVVNYWVQMEGVGNVQNFKTYSTDQRTIFNELLSVKWQVENEGNDQYVPLGYEQIGHVENSEGKERNIYENKYALPWAYTYEKCISYEELEGLNGIEKQEVLSQAVALDSENNGIDRFQINSEIIKLPYTVECSGCSWENGVLVNRKGLTRIWLNVDLPANYECYLRIKGFSVDGNFDEVLATNPSATTTILVLQDKLLKSSRAHAKEYPWYYGREDYLFCLGVSEEERDYVVISIPLEGEMKLEDIEVFAMPMDDYIDRVESLREEPLENIIIDDNTIKGDLSLSKDKILCLSVPYNRGWTAYVDGKRQEILNVNYAFMGLSLKEGSHKIEFRYSTPGLGIGVLLFGLSVCILVVIRIIEKKKTGEMK